MLNYPLRNLSGFVVESKQTIGSLRVILNHAQDKLKETEESLQKIETNIQGCKEINERFYHLITAIGERLLETAVDNVINQLEIYPAQYIEGERADKSSAWQEMRYLLNHIDYYDENDFLYSLSKRSVNDTSAYIDMAFSDESMRQSRLAEQVFKVIEEQTENLTDHEKAIIWGLNEDNEGLEWLFSVDEYEEKLMWSDDFIDNHIYHLLLDKAQNIPVTDNVVGLHE